MVIKKLKSCLHHKSIYCAGSDAIYANSGRLLFRAAQPSLRSHRSTDPHTYFQRRLWATAHCIRDLMVACWRYSADDISIMGLHCRQTHYKSAIRGNTGELHHAHCFSFLWPEIKTHHNMFQTPHAILLQGHIKELSVWCITCSSVNLKHLFCKKKRTHPLFGVLLLCLVITIK